MARKKAEAINSNEFKDVKLIFGERLTERVWQPKPDLRFKLRALTNREVMYVQSSVEQGGTADLTLRLGITGIEQDGFKPQWDELAILGKDTKILSPETLDAIPPILVPTLLQLIQMLTHLSQDEVDKLDFFQPLASEG